TSAPCSVARRYLSWIPPPWNWQVKGNFPAPRVLPALPSGGMRKSPFGKRQQRALPAGEVEPCCARNGPPPPFPAAHCKRRTGVIQGCFCKTTLNDPGSFRRLLIAQALVEGIPIISGDPVLDSYPIQRLW